MLRARFGASFGHVQPQISLEMSPRSGSHKKPGLGRRALAWRPGRLIGGPGRLEGYLQISQGALVIAAVGRRQDLHAQYALIGLVMDVANDALQGACRRLDRDQFACWNSL